MNRLHPFPSFPDCFPSLIRATEPGIQRLSDEFQQTAKAAGSGIRRNDEVMSSLYPVQS